MTVIFIDADACPVKEETKKVANRFGLKIILVSNGGIRPSRDPMVEIVIVAKGADVADDWIEAKIAKNDIVITQDILLASRALDRGALAIGVNGKEFTNENIGIKLAMRDLNQHLRETGEGGSYNKAFSNKDRSNFLQNLDLMVRKAKIL